MSSTPGFSVAGQLDWARDVLSEVLTTFAQKGKLLDQSQLDVFISAHKEYRATQHRLRKALGFWSFWDPELKDLVDKCGQLRDDIEAAWEESFRANVRGKVTAGDMSDNAQVVMESPVTVDTETPKSSASDTPLVNPSRPSPSKMSSASSTSGLGSSGRSSPTVKPREGPAPSLNTSPQLSGTDARRLKGTRPSPKHSGPKPSQRRPSALPESYMQSGCQIISGYADCPTMNTGNGSGNSGATKQWFFGGVPVNPPSEA